MPCYCHPELKKNILYATIFLFIISFIIGIFLFISCIINGPYIVNYLKKTECYVSNVEYIRNYCLDNADDLLLYKNDWKECFILSVNYTTIIREGECNYIYPYSFPDLQSAMIEYQQQFAPYSKTDCVVNMIDDTCFPDKHELTIVCSVLGTNIFILIFLIIFLKYFVKFH